MTTRAKAPNHAAEVPPGGGLRPASLPTTPCTLDERLRCIEALGGRINEYVRFMCQIGGLGGTSGEAKERAVTAFYERLVAVEGQLGRIQEDLRLG